MNEQRKVIYARRLQILDDEDMHDVTIALIEEMLADRGPRRAAPRSSPRSGTCAACSMVDLRPTARRADGPEQLDEYEDRDELIEAVVIDDARRALRAPSARSSAAAWRPREEIERDVMLQILDQRWREHLSDMDYLRDGHPPAPGRPAGPAHRLAARGLHDVRATARLDRPTTTCATSPTSRRVVEAPPAADEGLEGELRVTNAEPGRPGRRRAAAHEAAAARPMADVVKRRRQDRAQRAVLVRVGQEVQVLPWPTIGPRTRCATPSPTLEDLERALGAAREYLRIDELRAPSRRARARAPRDPDLWDDQDIARAVTTELGRVCLGPRRASTRCAARLDDAEVLGEFVARGARRRADAVACVDELARRRSRARRAPIARARAAEPALAAPRRERRDRSSCTPARAAPTPRTGPRCCCACTRAGPSAAASASRSTR